MQGISVRRLYQDNQAKLHLAWEAGINGADNRIYIDKERPIFSMVGHLNFIHPNRVQVVGLTEHEFLTHLEDGTETRISSALDILFNLDISMIIVANGLSVPKLLRDYCNQFDIPLVTSDVESPHLMDVLRVYLQRMLAVSTVVHGVFLDVYEIGVLLMGSSGLGKSELALELITRGHRLVADDAIELYRTAPEHIEGRCPTVLRDFLEVRGLGILNIRAMFGETSVRLRKHLQLIINLVLADDDYLKTIDRLNVQVEKEEILGVGIRKITIPVAVGRNLAVLVESAVQNYILQLRGIDSTREFLDRHTATMKESALDNETGVD